MSVGWIGVETVLAIHADQLAEHGGAPGVRDDGLLRSALARPRNLLAHEPQAGLARLAASYAYGIASNRALVDGNKRAAFAVAGVFLMVNGHRLDTTDREAERMVLQLAAGDISEAEFAEWVDRNLVAIED